MRPARLASGTDVERHRCRLEHWINFNDMHSEWMREDGKKNFHCVYPSRRPWHAASLHALAIGPGITLV